MQGTMGMVPCPSNRHEQMKTYITKKIIMNKKTFYAVSIAVAVLSGYSAYNSHSKSELSDVMLANVEALADDPESSDNEYPKYINKTDKNSYKDFKTDIKTDSTGAQISIQYSRTCTTYYTYCKHTGKEGDMCYKSLNGLVTDCESWSKD